MGWDILVLPLPFLCGCIVPTAPGCDMLSAYADFWAHSHSTVDARYDQELSFVSLSFLFHCLTTQTTNMSRHIAQWHGKI